MERFTAETSTPTELHRVPFFLEPDYASKPEGFSESHYTRMTRKFGSVEAFERVKLSHRLMPRAADAGLDADGWSNANLDRRVQSSTLRAHRLVLWADARLGWLAAEKAYAHLNHAHFVEGGLLNEMGLLRGAAAAAGLDADEAEAFLRGAQGEPEVWRTVSALSQMNVHSIPTLLIGGEVMAQGAAGEEEYLQTLRAHASRGKRRRRFDHSEFAGFR